MNKELYLNKEQSLKELEQLNYIVSSLKNFLITNEHLFKKEESIAALKRIKTYFELKEKEYKQKRIEYRKMYRELQLTCNHEVAMKYGKDHVYQCLICNEDLNWLSNDITEDSLISIDINDDYQTFQIIKNLFNDIVHSNKDLIKTIENTVEELQYERNIKVYRRSR